MQASSISYVKISETYTSREGNSNYELCSINSILTFLQLTFVGTHSVGRPCYECLRIQQWGSQTSPYSSQANQEKWFQVKEIKNSDVQMVNE